MKINSDVTRFVFKRPIYSIKDTHVIHNAADLSIRSHYFKLHAIFPVTSIIQYFLIFQKLNFSRAGTRNDIDYEITVK